MNYREETTELPRASWTLPIGSRVALRETFAPQGLTQHRKGTITSRLDATSGHYHVTFDGDSFEHPSRIHADNLYGIAGVIEDWTGWRALD